MAEAIRVLQVEIIAGRDLVNRLLYMSNSGTTRFENVPQ